MNKGYTISCNMPVGEEDDPVDMGTPKKKFVLWLDIMGIKEKMSRSLRQSASFIYKFHQIALRPQGAWQVFPVMDGAYVLLEENPEEVVRYIVEVFEGLYEEYKKWKDPARSFLVRGGLACGSVFTKLGSGESVEGKRDGVPVNVFVGFPVIQAHISEREAPPFGVYLHESVREYAAQALSESDFKGTWLRWYEKSKKADVKVLWNQVAKYYHWANRQMLEIGYRKEDIDRHVALFEQFMRRESGTLCTKSKQQKHCAGKKQK